VLVGTEVYRKELIRQTPVYIDNTRISAELSCNFADESIGQTQPPPTSFITLCTFLERTHRTRAYAFFGWRKKNIGAIISPTHRFLE
jgi:hypothetical protein